MRAIPFHSRIINVVLILALCLSTTMAQAQQPTTKPLDNQSTVPQQVSPGPLQPQPTEQPKENEEEKLPDAPSSTSQPSTTLMDANGNPVPAQTQSTATPATQQPLGTAAAEKATTAGGAASRPAGTAIAPVKQRQVRSFLLKLGLIAAGGVALGTVYGLSKSSPPKPPNSQ